MIWISKLKPLLERLFGAEAARIIAAVAAVVVVAIPVLTELDFDKGTPLYAAIMLAAGELTRRQVWSAATVADISAEPAGEIDAA